MVRRILGKLTSDEIKAVVAGQEKLKGDGNKDNYQKVLTQVIKSAANRAKREFGEVELLDDGSVVLRYECMKDHEILTSLLIETEMIREAVTFQSNIIKAQIQAAQPQKEAPVVQAPAVEKK